MNNKPTGYRVEYLCGGCNKAHAWGECTEEKELKNEPAAYLVKAPDGEYLVFEKSEHPVMADCTYIPLYTHQYERPQNTVLVPCDKLAEMQAELALLKAHPTKELGYNDIMGTWWETMPNAKSCEGVFEFAKAILRKAQEK
jgi:hypothetical protein